MGEGLEHKELAALWLEFMSERGRRHELTTIADLFPDIRTLTVDFSQIERFNPDLAEYFLENPIEAILAAEEAIQEIIPPEKKGVARIHFRVEKLPHDTRVDIRKIRAKHLGKFLSVEGLIRKATEVRPRLVTAKFQCMRCGAYVSIEQDGLHFQEPLECDQQQGGCGRGAGSTRFRLIVEESIFVDTQKIEIQESPEGLRGGAEPQRLVAYAEDDITGKIFPGDRVLLNGTLRSVQKGSAQRSTLFDINLELNSVEFEEHEYEEVTITPEEEQAIRELAASPDIFKKIAGSISPTIYGYPLEKETLALQLFGGIQKKMDDGTRIRGDVHILLVGDPGVAKTMILRYMADLAPRGIYASGKSSTAAGLTAAAIKDEFGEGRWTLEAGALVLADKGIACVDELDKMSPQDRSSIHESREQQTVSVAKAGITATLQSRCAVLGAANPKYGRFDESRTIAEQIDLPPTLLTRFDVIFAMTDRPNPKEDIKVAKHILRAHRRGEVRRYENTDQIISGIDGAAIMADVEELVPIIDRELLRKYVAFSKRLVPILSDGAMKSLEEYYVSIRSLGEQAGSSVPITARQLEALIRLSEASARVRLSQIVTEDDAARSIRIVEYFLQKVASEGGRLDIDIIATGYSRSQVEHIQMLRKLVRDLSDPAIGVMESELLQRAESEGIPPEKAKALIKKLSDAGELYSPRPGSYRLATEERL